MGSLPFAPTFRLFYIKSEWNTSVWLIQWKKFPVSMDCLLKRLYSFSIWIVFYLNQFSICFLKQSCLAIESLRLVAMPILVAHNGTSPGNKKKFWICCFDNMYKEQQIAFNIIVPEFDRKLKQKTVRMYEHVHSKVSLNNGIMVMTIPPAWNLEKASDEKLII
jgi:hypothetical protein